MEIWEPKTPGTLWATPGLLRDDDTNNQQTHFDIYNVLYSKCSHKHVSAAIMAIFRAMLMLQKYESTKVVNCVTAILQQLKL